VVGDARDGSFSKAVIWSGTTAIDLNTLLDTDSSNLGWILTVAEAINAKGQIVGVMSRRDDPTEFGAFLLTPDVNTPIPATLPLFATGLGALMLLARRRARKNAGTA
jgi:hypothetical protein